MPGDKAASPSSWYPHSRAAIMVSKISMGANWPAAVQHAQIVVRTMENELLPRKSLVKRLE